MPVLVVAQALAPVVPKRVIEMALPGLMHERRRVNAVRHEADQILFRPDFGPVIRHEPRRHDAVNTADAVHAACTVQREPRHVEQARHGRRTSQIEETIDGKSQLANEIIEVGHEQLVPEGIVSRRHRRMRRERALTGHSFDRRAIRKAARKMLTQQLENEERRVAFVEMEHRRLQTERAHRAQPADAENHLLPDSGGLVAAVQAIADVAIGRRVLRAIRIEEIDRDAPDLRLPYPRADFPPCDTHGDREPAPVIAVHRLDRQIARIMVPILGVLHAVVVDRLLEIALPVQQANGDEVHALVACRLAVIAGEHAETAGINREALVKAILGAEVGDERCILERRRGGVLVERPQRLRVTPEIGRIPRCLFQRCLTDATKQQSWVTFGLLPQLGIEVFEQCAGRPMPAEEQVARELGESRERFRNYRNDFKYRVSHVFSAVQGRASLAASRASPR